MKQKYGDINVTLLDGFVAECEIGRPPNNFFDLSLIRDMADCFDDLDADPNCRAIVLRNQIVVTLWTVLHHL